ncbi:MAG: NTP transferase domain-containing protein [Melioribacteraceae bacterium]|nr:NTP transferase domain-containing protein [Melioribacteraceae bacterium]
MQDTKTVIKNEVQKSLAKFDYNNSETAIILAAGHGKRIKSQTSKMLHQIWGKPTVERVFDACREGLQKANIIVVVGIKALDVIQSIGERPFTSFAYQEEQNGTGHAVQVALDNIDSQRYEGVIYILPGDMGLIDKKTLSKFKKTFLESENDMMVLTGLYDGPSEGNNYGRIIRVKHADVNNKKSRDDEGKVIEILEHKDILKLDADIPYQVEFKGRLYSYTKEELLENNEFNSGVYAFKFKALSKLIGEIKNDNVQNEIYITDLISIFNKNKLSVGAVHPDDQHVLMGFNNKSVLKEMEKIARHRTYDLLKNIIDIEDPDDFFIDEQVVNKILKMDNDNVPLDIKIGKGVYIGKGVELNYNLTLKKNVFIEGNIIFGRNVIIWENAYLSTFANQKFVINDNVEILWGDIIKGNIIIGKNSRIESSVNMTGSDEYPLRVGEKVVIKGTSYIFGSLIDDGMYIEHSVLIKKRIRKIKENGKEINTVKFYLPIPEGTDTISTLE